MRLEDRDKWRDYDHVPGLSWCSFHLRFSPSVIAVFLLVTLGWRLFSSPHLASLVQPTASFWVYRSGWTPRVWLGSYGEENKNRGKKQWVERLSFNNAQAWKWCLVHILEARKKRWVEMGEEPGSSTVCWEMRKWSAFTALWLTWLSQLQRSWKILLGSRGWLMRRLTKSTPQSHSTTLVAS